MIKAILNYGFMQHAVISILLASVVCSIIGTIIIEKKLVMMSGGIAHTSFGGVGLGFLLGISPIYGGLLFALIAAIAIVTIKRRTRATSDVLIATLWSLGMALGILFVSLMPGYPPDLTSYLFGDILTVSTGDIYLMIFLCLLILLVFLILFSYIKSYLFDEEYLQALGIPTVYLDYVVYILIALSIVILIKVVGIILVITLLTIPPAIAKIFTYRFHKIILLAGLLSIVFGFLGLVFSYYYNISSGASIIILSSIGYFLCMLSSRKQ